MTDPPALGETSRLTRSDHKYKNAYQPRYTLEKFFFEVRRGRFEAAASITLLEIVERADFRGRSMNLKVIRDLQIANFVFVTSASEAVLRPRPL